jgi:hypothetical protein
MKKNMLFGMIAWLSVSLFFLGCPTDASDDNDTSYNMPDQGNGAPPNSGQSGKALADALTSLGITVTDDGKGNITITGSPTLSTPVSVPNGATLSVATGQTLTVDAPLTVSSGGTLSVPGTSTLTVNGGKSLTVAGTLDAEGTLDVAGPVSVENGGTISIALGANGDLTDTITVKAGGTIEDLNDGGGSLWGGSGTGSYVYEAGAKAFVANSGTPVLRIGGAGTGATIELASGADLTQTKTAYTLSGNVTVKDNYGVVSQNITIGASSTLTVDLSGTDKNVYLFAQMKIEGTATTSSIVITGTGAPTDNTIQLAQPNTNGNNFYASGTKNGISHTKSGLYAGTYTGIPGGTYTWSTSADGGSAAGWTL